MPKIINEKRTSQDSRRSCSVDSHLRVIGLNLPGKNHSGIVCLDVRAKIIFDWLTCVTTGVLFKLCLDLSMNSFYYLVRTRYFEIHSCILIFNRFKCFDSADPLKARPENNYRVTLEARGLSKTLNVLSTAFEEFILRLFAGFWNSPSSRKNA